MGGESPVAELYDSNGIPLSVQDGVAIPATTPGLLSMGSDGTNSRFMAVDSSGRSIIVGVGTAGTPAGGVLSIQGVSGGQAVPISGTVTANAGSGNFAVVQATAANLNATVVGTVTANIGTTNGLALDATLAKLTIAQGASLGTNTQALIGGSVTTVSPTYTTGQISPISLTTAGAIRIDGSGVTQPVSGTVTANAGTGNFTVVQATAANLNATVTGSVTANIGTTNGLALDATLTGGTQTTRITDGTNTATVKAASTAAVATDKALVVAISPNNSVNAFPSDVTTSGALGALNAAVTITHPGLESVGFQLAAGTLAATLVAEVSFDGGTTWNATYFKRSSDDAKFATIGLINPNSAQAYSIVGAGGAGQTRVRVSAYTSGTANGTIRASNIIDVQPLYASTIGAVAPPSAVQIGGANAGTTVAAVMKGSSTAAAAADASLVTALSPNSPLPTGTNNIGSVNYVQSAETTAAWTSSTTNNTALALTVTGYGTVTVTLNQGSTITGGAVTFEGSDTVAGTNWYPISMVSTAGATVPTSTYTLVASTNVAFQTNVAGFIQFRVRLSPAISGTGTVNVGIAANASATEWQQATYITDGTHGPVSVKAASTAAVASDQPLVVTLHPSSASLSVTVTPSGANPTIIYGDVVLNTITTAAIERTTYTEQTTNFTGSVVSSSASDASAGTGARQVKITYVDSTGATAGTETVTLNGTTAVNLVTTTKCFIEKMEVTSVGSTGNNVGTISLFTGAAGAGTLVGTIGATDNKTFWAHHYVVTGKTFNLTSFIAGSTQAVANNGSSWVLKSKTIGVATAVEVQINDTITLYGQSSQVTRNYTTAIPVASGPTRVRAYVTTLASASATYRGAFDFYES